MSGRKEEVFRQEFFHWTLPPICHALLRENFENLIKSGLVQDCISSGNTMQRGDGYAPASLA
jgi:hypothetical protein